MLTTPEENSRTDAIDALNRELARKRQFVMMVAHEMRNLLAPLTYEVELLARADAETTVRIRTAIVRQIAHLKRFINDLLDVACTEAGLMNVNTDPLELRDVIAAAVDVARPVIAARQQHLTLALDPRAGSHIAGDQCRLTQVLSNLLINAAKFTPEGGAIRVSLEDETPQVKLCVRDTGVGIPRDELPRIFEVYVRGAHGPDQALGGLGLGLAVARHLVELHGGTLSANSAGAGQGTEFVMRLPTSG